MPAFGGLTPGAERYGGGTPRLQIILESLNRQRGTAYDTTSTSNVYVENMAIARAIDAAWSANQRLAYIWDPARMDASMLTRWEKILKIVPLFTDTFVDRRARISAIFARIGRATLRYVLVDLLTAALGSVFVAVEYIDIANAVVHVPDGSYPFGTVNADAPWYSTVNHILVRTQKPTGWTEGQFYEAVANVYPVCDPVIPAWCVVDWYRPGPVSTPVTGGPSAGGFYLDNPANLDNQVFA